MAREETSSTPVKAPPGMVIGPDGKPCKICTAFRDWNPRKTGEESVSNRPAKTWPAPETKSASSRNGTRNDANASVAPASSSNGAQNGVHAAAIAAPDAVLGYRSDEPPPGCPPDVQQLGRATWTFLHTTAAYYPEKPTPTQRANMLMLLSSLPILYPCGWCARDFGKNLEKSKPDVSGRAALSRWLCERHNEVNIKLGKEKFDCDKADERWREGPPDGSCD